MGGYYSPSPNDTITAANWKTYVRDQTVNQFASATARDSAITSPLEGMLAYLNDINVLVKYTGAAWAPAATQLIASTTLGAATASVTFSSIPGIFNSLMVCGGGKATGATSASDVSCQINGDSGSNYRSLVWYGNQVTPGPSVLYTGSETTISRFASIPGSTYATAARVASWMQLFPNYTNTTLYKACIGHHFMTDGGTSYNKGHSEGIWQSTSAITQLVLTNSVGNFDVGSSFHLYGLA